MRTKRKLKDVLIKISEVIWNDNHVYDRFIYNGIKEYIHRLDFTAPELEAGMWKEVQKYLDTFVFFNYDDDLCMVGTWKDQIRAIWVGEET